MSASRDEGLIPQVVPLFIYHYRLGSHPAYGSCNMAERCIDANVMIAGWKNPLNIYEALGVGQLRTRLQVAARRGLTRFVVQTSAEEGVLTGERGSYRLTHHATTLHVPTTVQGVLAARIDRLTPEEKALLQQLAVIGREFPLRLVQHIVSQSEEELYRLLSSLQRKEPIFSFREVSRELSCSSLWLRSHKLYTRAQLSPRRLRRAVSDMGATKVASMFM